MLLTLVGALNHCSVCTFADPPYPNRYMLAKIVLCPSRWQLAITWANSTLGVAT
jgi:hypothetical protein